MTNQFWDNDDCGGCRQLEKENEGLHEKIKALQVKVIELEAALWPFADAANRWPMNSFESDVPLPDDANLARAIRVGDWRKAADIILGKKP